MSKPITLSIPHQLGRTEARRRIDEGFSQFANQFGGAAHLLSKSWTGDRLNFALSAVGQSISGLIDVADDVVRLEVVLPGFLAMIAGKVRGRLQKEGQILLEKK